MSALAVAAVEPELSNCAFQPIELLLGEGVADLLAREIRFRDGQVNRLTPMETDLLRFLARSWGKTVSRAELLRNVWRLDPARVMTRTVDIHIGKLRRQLRDDTKPPHLLISIRGIGYMLNS